MELPADFRHSDFSEYLPDGSQNLVDTFRDLGDTRGFEGLEFVIDEFDRLTKTEDKIRLQYSLTVYLTDSQAFSQYGVRLPSIEERSPWKIV